MTKTEDNPMHLKTRTTRTRLMFLESFQFGLADDAIRMIIVHEPVLDHPVGVADPQLDKRSDNLSR
jgi:hypothetical protein